MARHGHSASGAPFAEVAGDVGASPPRTATSSPPIGGNCTNRAATRRRHAEGRLLMLQNPHRQPDIHPGAEGGGSESTGALRDTGLATTPAGGDPTTSRHISHVISPRSLFETARKRCNSNDVDSTFELIAGELRATLMGRGRAWPSFETTRRRHAEGRLLMLQNPHHYPWRHAPSPVQGCPAGADKRQKGVADRTGAGERAGSSATGLVADEAKHPIGDHSTRSDRAQCSRSGGIFTMGCILSEALRREHASPTTPPSTIPGTEPRPTRLTLLTLPVRPARGAHRQGA